MLRGWSPSYLSGYNPVFQSYFLFHKLSLCKSRKSSPILFTNQNLSPISQGLWKWKVKVAQSCPILSPWNSPGQNTGVGSPSLLQGIIPTQDWTQVSRIADGFFTSWASREAPRLVGIVKMQASGNIFLGGSCILCWCLWDRCLSVFARTEVCLFGMQTSGRKFFYKKRGGQYLETR